MYRVKLADKNQSDGLDDAILTRIEIGRKQRANTNKRKRDQIERLTVKIADQKKTIRKLRDRVNATCETNETPVKVLWGSLTPRTKMKVKGSLRENTTTRGTNSAFRRALGINILPPVPLPRITAEDLVTKIADLLCQDEISKVSPDKNKTKNGTQIRFRLHYLSVLHARFVAETGMECHYSTFTRHVPQHVIKPKASDWGTCLCAICLNPELKIEKLTKLGYLKPVVLDRMDDDGWELLFAKLEEHHVNISYVEWRKVTSMTGPTFFSRKFVSTKPMAMLAGELAEELRVLQEHLHRVKTQYKAFREAKHDAMAEDTTAMLQIDWSENVELNQTRQEHSSYYGKISVSIHAGYIWSKETNYGFAALSDCTDHKAATVWSSLTPTLETLVQNGKEKIIIVSDSPSSQYLNKSSFFFGQQFAKSHGVSLTRIFLESGHGKGTADGIGAVTKRVINDNVSFSPDEAIKDAAQHLLFNCLKTVYKMIQGNTSVWLSVYKESDVRDFEAKLPHLKPMRSTKSRSLLQTTCQ